MSRPATAVLLGTLLALAPTSVLVPVGRRMGVAVSVWETRAEWDRDALRHHPDRGAWELLPVWRLGRTEMEPTPADVLPRHLWPYEETYVRWELLMLAQGGVLVCGGALLTWVLRRDRRRRAEAGA